MVPQHHQPDLLELRTPFQKFDEMAKRVFNTPKAGVAKLATKMSKAKEKPRR